MHECHFERSETELRNPFLIAEIFTFIPLKI